MGVAVADGDGDDEPDDWLGFGVGLGDALDVRDAGVVPVPPAALPEPDVELAVVFAELAAACFLHADAWTDSSSIFFWALPRSLSGIVAWTCFCW